VWQAAVAGGPLRGWALWGHPAQPTLYQARAAVGVPMGASAMVVRLVVGRGRLWIPPLAPHALLAAMAHAGEGAGVTGPGSKA
jgi:hypothetical protein